MKYATIFGSTLALAAALVTSTDAQPVGQLTVVELFQSQGCSSCPPANANVGAISDRSDVLALSFAVTYWDHLGWHDTFAQPQFTARQYAYARGLGHPNVYTPQVVVNGRQDLTGINRGELDAALGNRVPALAIALENGALKIPAGATQAASDIWLVRYDRRTLQVPITAGENSGSTLPHKNIVRELVRLGSWSGAAESFRLPPPTDRNFATAALIEAPNGGPILAAAKLD